ncbi:hypothetical protein AB6A40_003902 [Gnathostoma spinigerum]|uniref:Uncharacterized protein n=1 Tax=Gnathostoma spinigerum TaxID=75299 RepID=A0ABD6EB29_9BILA
MLNVPFGSLGITLRKSRSADPLDNQSGISLRCSSQYEKSTDNFDKIAESASASASLILFNDDCVSCCRKDALRMSTERLLSLCCVSDNLETRYYDIRISSGEVDKKFARLGIDNPLLSRYTRRGSLNNSLLNSFASDTIKRSRSKMELATYGAPDTDGYNRNCRASTVGFRNSDDSPDLNAYFGKKAENGDEAPMFGRFDRRKVK